MKAYKFLARGAVGPFSGLAWPGPRGDAPGAWVEAEGTLAPCMRGVHVCRPTELAHWLHDELWEAEAVGDRIEGLDCLVVRRARLVRRIDGWQEGGAARFAEACVAHASELVHGDPCESVRVYLDDAVLAADAGFPAVSAFSAALAVARLADQTGEDPAFRHERAWQSGWIARVLLAA